MNVSINSVQNDSDHASTERKSRERLSPKPIEPDPAVWKDKNTYGNALIERFLEPLRAAKLEFGPVPQALQNSVLLQLHWYFTTDLRERSPTVVVTEPMAVEFHALVKEIMSYIEVDTISAIDENLVSQEVKHAILSYKGVGCCSPATLDAYDHDQGLVRISYFVHGTPPSETFLLDGERVEPAYQKYRGCRFFRRLLFRQRIVWLPASGNKTLQVLLDGEASELTVGPSPFLPCPEHKRNATAQTLQAARSVYPPGKGSPHPIQWNLTGLKVRLVRWLASLPPVRRKFAKAWIFIDRETEADDNAEHLYRWVKKHHPEVNAWFLLDRSSTDWNRLAAEGFRLMSQSWMRKLLILNSEHIISSHAEYMYGGFSPLYYGDMMRWRYTFLQHGVTKDDLSHWLSNQPFDLFITASPAEHSSIVDNDTPYTYTEKEMRRTGLARHDRLVVLAKQMPIEKANLLLVMPTWRGSLHKYNSEYGVASSAYVTHWGALLRSSELRSVLNKEGIRLAFMPHTNALPYLRLFNIPDDVLVFTKVDLGIQELFSRSIAMVSDYSSVAFEMAALRRLVFYYQFDRESFYGGDHNWREGYFSYERDGFGPVATREDELVDIIRRTFSNKLENRLEYLARMERAIPEQDSLCCERTYQNIVQLNQPYRRRR